MQMISEILTAVIVLIAIVLLIVRAIKRLRNPFSCCSMDNPKIAKDQNGNVVSPCTGCASYSKCNKALSPKQ